LAELKRQDRHVHLRAVGPFETPEYEGEIRRLAADLNVAAEIEWRGFRGDIAAELASMDVFVFPSILPEGMPMVVLEAMAAGVPVVASQVSGVVEIIREGRDGLLAAPGEHDDLALAIARLMDGRADWNALRQAAHARQSAHFSASSMAAGVAEVYRDVLSACDKK
jgi:glycosyltransferase involved in cell wall biosynthesis